MPQLYQITFCVYSFVDIIVELQYFQEMLTHFICIAYQNQTNCLALGFKLQTKETSFLSTPTTAHSRSLFVEI